MIGKILYGGAIWIASNPTGRKIAFKSFKLLSKLGNCAVTAMPNNISNMFSGTEKAFAKLISDEPKK